MEYLTVGNIKQLIAKLPDDTKIYYERIEDVYFKKHGWKATPLAADMWADRAFPDQVLEEYKDLKGEWIETYEAFYNEEENALKITAHY